MSDENYFEFKVWPSRERFAAIARDPAEWWRVGEGLLESASLLWPHVRAGLLASMRGEASDGDRHSGAFYLLVGLAVENCAKALVVQRSGPAIAPDDVLRVAGGKHDLVHWWRQTDVPLGLGTEALLARLSRSIQWQGRYPLPKRASDLPDMTGRGTRDLEDVRKAIELLRLEFNRRAATS